jgi:hypothetical protein
MTELNPGFAYDICFYKKAIKHLRDFPRHAHWLTIVTPKLIKSRKKLEKIAVTHGRGP